MADFKLFWWLLGGAGLAAAGAAIYTSQFPAPQSAVIPLLTLPTTKKSFVDAVSYAIDVAQAGLGDDARALIIAHAALESGYGKSAAARKGNNLFNIVAGSRWAGPTVPGPDANAAGQPIVQQWRVYGAFDESVSDYLSLLLNGSSSYQLARQQLINGDIGFIANLKAGGYFELDLPTYASRFRVYLAEVQKMLQGSPPLLA